MAHVVTQSAYARLTERLNRFPQGAPPAERLTKILKILFDQKEAEMVSLLPVKPFTVKKAARVWEMSEKEARKVLDPPRRKGAAGRFSNRWADALRAAAAHGRVFRIFPDAHPQGYRPEAAVRTFLPVFEPGGGLCSRTLRHGTDPAREGFRQRDGPCPRKTACTCWTGNGPAK